jgi:hypothetical protein
MTESEWLTLEDPAAMLAWLLDYGAAVGPTPCSVEFHGEHWGEGVEV